MHPFLRLSNTVVLDSYYVMLTIGVLAGSLVSLITLRKTIGWVKALVMVGIMIWGALFGAHLAHCIFHWGTYRAEPSRLLTFWKDGHSLAGAPAFCVLLLLILSKTFPGIPFLATTDAFSLGTPLGLFFARIGCYMKGCCWGIPIPEGHLFHGISYKLLNFRLTALHPVQLYSATADLLMFLCLLLVMRKWKREGLMTVIFSIMYGAARFTLEFFRGDTPRIPWLWNLSLHQGLCILLLVGTVCFVLVLRQKGTHAVRHQ
jgi:phosphatidylglycerol:prolipoprotein diacylglycerol transferase